MSHFDACAKINHWGKEKKYVVFGGIYTGISVARYS
jgi:hypothetical protein